jgi:hypothetical protein
LNTAVARRVLGQNAAIVIEANEFVARDAFVVGALSIAVAIGSPGDEVFWLVAADRANEIESTWRNEDRNHSEVDFRPRLMIRITEADVDTPSMLVTGFCREFLRLMMYTCKTCWLLSSTCNNAEYTLVPEQWLCAPDRESPQMLLTPI